MRAISNSGLASRLMGALALAAVGCGVGQAGDDLLGDVADDVRRQCPDDGNPCTIERRQGQRCLADPLPDGAPCPGGSCRALVCVAAPPIAPDAGAPAPSPDAGSPPDAAGAPDASSASWHIANCAALGTETLGTGPIATSPVPLPAYNALNPLATAVTPPDFGTRIVRVTGNPGEAIPNTGDRWRTDKPWYGPAYTKDPVWNADQSLMVVKAALDGGRLLFLRGSNYVPAFTRGVSGVRSNLEGLRWHPKDPAKMVYVKTTGEAGWYFPVEDRLEVRIPAPGGMTSCTIGNGEGELSDDGNRVAITCNCTQDTNCDFWVVDLLAQQRVSPVVNSSVLGFSAMDSALVSPDGQHVVASQNWARNVSISITGSCASAFSASCLIAGGVNWSMGHFDACRESGTNAPVVYSAGNSYYVRYGDAQRVDVVPRIGIGDHWHTSCRNLDMPGWGYGTLEDAGGLFQGELFAQELKAGTGAKVRRLVKHRSTITSGGTIYDHTPFAVPSPDGKRVFFRSDWGNPNACPGNAAAGGPTDCVYGFVVELSSVCP